ncbi:MAG TPA: hypothetical protein ENK05_11755 [Gammaproteobacteria bacterium]|nr:hypothetical protein [Gammaproteobacteria bacterium]
MAAFPSYGKLVLQDYGETPNPAVLRTEMEGGPPKQAQILSRVMVIRPVTMIYSASEFASFKTWFRDQIARGADWFDWTDPVDGQLKQARIVSSQQQPSWQATPFTESPGAPLSWEVRMQIETWE